MVVQKGNLMTQLSLIRASLESGQVLTPLDALHKFGCLSLSQRIGDLERQGLAVEHIPYRTPSGKWVMSYCLLRIPY